MNPIFSKLAGLFSGKGADLVKSITGLIDVSKFSAEEKAEFEAKAAVLAQEHELAMATLAQTELETQMKDIADSRSSNVHIQESDKASWMAKNVGYLLDLSVAILFYAMLFLIFFVTIPQDNKEIFYTAFGVLGAKYGSSFDFHRGSSSGSKASADTLRQLVKNK